MNSLSLSLHDTMKINQTNYCIIHLRMPRTLKLSSQLFAQHIVANSSHLSRTAPSLLNVTLFNEGEIATGTDHASNHF